MDDTSKYLIHATFTADGVVERSDVVGAIFGQTEGLLGDELDLRDLQQSSKVGRIDVEVESERGQSHGHITIASSLDKVKTAILAASLETISRVGPCQATVEVADIEDVREAKRRAVVERAKELLAGSFDDSLMTSSEILEEVRESVRVEAITEYEDLPAGPRVTDSDAIIVVEGRADVLTLLRYGIKNAIAVEGTNVPDAVAALTSERTVTAFLDGDRGGELILRELAQVGDVDYVAFAPEGRSVEDLARHEVMSALRGKVPFETLPDEGSLRSAADSDETGETGETSETRGAGEAGSDPVGPQKGSQEATDAAAAAPPGDVNADGPRVDTGAETGGDADGSVAGTEPTPEGDLASQEQAPTAETDGAGVAAGQAVESPIPPDESAAVRGDDAVAGTPGADVTTDATTEHATAGSEDSETDADGAGEGETTERSPTTLRGHVRAVIGGGTGRVRFLDAEMETVGEEAAVDAFDALEGADPVPYAVILDGELSQRVLDVAAQRGVEHVVATSTGEFVKKPIAVRVRTADELARG